jgi:arginine/ornithine N-succinyltransferase beta subunit
LIGTTAEHFRACNSHLEIHPDEGLIITAAAARGLEVNVGDAIRFVELNPDPELLTPKAV